MDRVISFSIAPANKKAREDLQKIKEHCSSTGTSFSYLMIKALAFIVKDLKL